MTSKAGSCTVGVLALVAAALAVPEAARALPLPTAPSLHRAEPAQFYGYRGPYWRYGLRRPFAGPGYRRFGFRPYGYGYGYGGPFRPYGFRRPFRFGGLRRF